MKKVALLLSGIGVAVGLAVIIPVAVSQSPPPPYGYVESLEGECRETIVSEQFYFAGGGKGAATTPEDALAKIKQDSSEWSRRDVAAADNPGPPLVVFEKSDGDRIVAATEVRKFESGWAVTDEHIAGPCPPGATPPAT